VKELKPASDPKETDTAVLVDNPRYTVLSIGREAAHVTSREETREEPDHTCSDCDCRIEPSVGLYIRPVAVSEPEPNLEE
jgi:hypothetical protein